MTDFPKLHVMRMHKLLSFIILFCVHTHAQNVHGDSLQLSAINLSGADSLVRRLEAKMENDTSKANLLGLLSYHFAFREAEKSVMYGQQGIQLSRELGYKRGIAYCSQSLAMGLWGVGNYGSGLEVALKALHLYEELGDEERIGFTHYVLANIYRDFGDYKRAHAEVQKGFKIFQALNTSDVIGHAIIGSIYDLQGRVDSASLFIRNAFELNGKINSDAWGWLYYLQGNIYRKKKQYDLAMYYYRAALPFVAYKDIVETYNGIATLYNETGKLDSSIHYASEVLQKWRFVSYQRGILQAANILAEVYKRKHQQDSVIKYLELGIALNNTMFNREKERDVQNMAFTEQLRQDEIFRERQQNRNRLRMYTALCAGLVLLITSLLLLRNNRQKKKANVLLLRQKVKVENALQDLKATQIQLIQSEKMASLGELTAGIAHEIQNPLNFVNNFSEVSNELIGEMKEQLATGNVQQANELAEDLKQNLEKIDHHGKRADAIVKAMLQHSRTSSGAKEFTDINALCDEYLKLAYHGLRAKDKTFNASLERNFDNDIGKINVVAQDIGRVILNLINNAFYAVNERQKAEGVGYEPVVAVSTKKINGKVEIKVKDNGTGIPQNVRDKIFQPFFTTKPTGQGTGLGLSLAYDIVKAHGGEIRVESKEGEGTEFVIHLPQG